ncbi:rhodanese-like domain-containing protein [Kallotenue papyrolyticum]|uniref:rhodanese-like domain-containing protein n=1 Tax=Kallotenue papyrolyticum TaxID=1325125 RepID=UPI0004B22855|nr:rhodanese-like domain-containing protein [Kallotenue papyrolyticum]
MTQRLPFKQATPREIKQRLDAGDDLLLIDVREPEEVRIVALSGAQLCPLSQAALWIDRLPHDRELVLFCHHGGRSAQVAWALAQRGYTNVTNLEGGIDRWAVEVDPSLPRY